MKICLIYNTKRGPVDTGVHLHVDYHIDLAYRLVQSGMLGLTAKKHWSFALLEAGRTVSSIPMYKPHRVKEGLTQWFPRIPEKEVRGSFRVVYGILSEMRSVGNSEKLRQILKETDEPELPEVGSEPSPDGDLTRLFTEAYEAWEARADGTPAPEIIHFPDGTKQLVVQWGQVDPLVSQSAVELPVVVGVCDEPSDCTQQSLIDEAQESAELRRLFLVHGAQESAESDVG
ncbi:TPA_asm: hypothetical protein [ssRNA phage SRR7976310_1]|uniref:Uncharacterized protein n=1 Tax=ssRNA phage SRR7976310_1 TaxID=2786671 RepID=A0A8S5L0G9_9VIRU|nr:hypothetical protein QII40_gp3 [ssRNA phage SRR7976310_1]DAD51129.1 TPA_asm: hypothetical protein [ssRNA phage SRR7976310_1]